MAADKLARKSDPTSNRLSFELAHVQVVVKTSPVQQIVVCPLLDNPAMVSDQYLVGIADGAQAMSENKAGPPFHEAHQRFMDADLGAGIYGAGSLSPSLTLSLAPSALVPSGGATLAVTETHTGTLLSGLLYTVPITATGGGFTRTASVDLLVGGVQVYLPLVVKE